MTQAQPKKGKPKTRSNGSGTIFKTPEGRFRWQYRLSDGKILASGTEDTKRKADDKLSQNRTEYLHGKLISTDTVTFERYAQRWLEEQQRYIRPKTYNLYKYELNLACQSIGHKQLREIRPINIKEMLMRLSNTEMTSGLGMGKTMSSRTLGMIRTRVSAVFMAAIAEEIIGSNPVAPIKALRKSTDETENGGISLDIPQLARFREIGTLLFQFGISRFFPALFTAISIGLRRGEVLALRWSDIDLENAVLRVRVNLTKETGKEKVLGKPKTSTGQREIPLRAGMLIMLQEQKSRVLAEFCARGQSLTPDSPVFPTEIGTFAHPDTLARALNALIDWSNPEPVKRHKIRKTDADEYIPLEIRLNAIPIAHRGKLEQLIKAGVALPNISPHDLRHTAGSMMLRGGMTVEVVSKILGHKDITTTYRIYRHVLESEKQEKMIDIFDMTLASK